MRSINALRLATLCGVPLLVACKDELVAPIAAPTRTGVAASFGICGGYQAERIQSMTTPPELAGVTVTANFPGSSGLPWNVIQQMQFPLNYGADHANCLNSPVATYVAETLYVAPTDTIAVPDGVDPEFWASLSPRERKVLFRVATQLMALYPNRYPTIGSAIDGAFGDTMLRAKVKSKLRGIDYFGASQEAELLAGGVYGCSLYQAFVTRSDWNFSNAETLTLVIELVTAFAEAEFRYQPLRALVFGRNGTVGAAMAEADPFLSDCGRMTFDSISSGRISVTDPYSTPRAPSPGYTPPPQDPPPTGSLPIGWMDQ